ncbi:alpha/beta fold hydrolase [Oleidesulfovibrio sp.]|uniref:alpha/beta fold hydrolase n=1 Tax=Oleidesulfovibrio sp. TaxID=2909707 RepID=UPI003A86A86A
MSDWNLKQTFFFENREIRYDVEGNGPAVVLVHGTPWSSYNLRHLIAGLRESYTVYYYDMAGYGQSDKSDADVSLGIQNRILSALLDHWQLSAPFIIGHDFGGATVLRTQLLDGRDFRKIVLIDPVALSPWGSPFFKHVQQHEQVFAGVPDYIHEAIVEAYVKTAAHLPLPEETLRSIILPWTGSAGKAAFYRQIAQADSAYTDEIQEKMRGISCPVLLLWGEEDTWIPIQQARALHGTISTSALITIPKTGHLVIEERPGALLAEIGRYLR